MASEQIPEAWIGKRVAVGGPNHSITGELIEVNDRGVAVAYKDTYKDTEQHTERRRGYGGFAEDVQTDEIRFYPWEQVRVLRYVEQEQETG